MYITKLTGLKFFNEVGYRINAKGKTRLLLKFKIVNFIKEVPVMFLSKEEVLLLELYIHYLTRFLEEADQIDEDEIPVPKYVFEALQEINNLLQ